jgi:hypothetical protein
MIQSFLHIFERNKCVPSQKDKNICGDFIHNHPKPEILPMSVKKRMDKSCYHHGIKY